MSSVQFNQNFFDVNEPHLKDLLELFKKQSDLDFSCHHIGTIQKFDPVTQTAQVTINYKQTYWTFDKNSSNYVSQNNDYPILADCPVIVLGGGSTRITFPIKKGDQCILLFNDRDIDNWFTGSTTSPNATPRLHSFADAIALVGLNNQNSLIQNYDPDRGIITNGTTKNGINPETNKLTLTNGTSLNTLLQNLCTQLENLTAQIALITVITGGVTSTVPTNASSFTMIGNTITTIANDISQLIE